MLTKKAEIEVNDTVIREDAKENKIKFNQYDDNIIKKAIQQNLNVYKITVKLAKDCMLKSARAFIVFQTVERYAEIFKSEPKVEDIEDEKFENEFTIAIITKEPEAIIKKDLESISEILEVIFEKVEVSVEDSGADIIQGTIEDKDG